MPSRWPPGRRTRRILPTRRSRCGPRPEGPGPTGPPPIRHEPGPAPGTPARRPERASRQRLPRRLQRGGYGLRAPLADGPEASGSPSCSPLAAPPTRTAAAAIERSPRARALDSSSPCVCTLGAAQISPCSAERAQNFPESGPTCAQVGQTAAEFAQSSAQPAPIWGDFDRAGPSVTRCGPDTATCWGDFGRNYTHDVDESGVAVMQQGGGTPRAERDLPCTRTNNACTGVSRWCGRFGHHARHARGCRMCKKKSPPARAARRPRNGVEPNRRSAPCRRFPPRMLPPIVIGFSFPQA